MRCLKLGTILLGLTMAGASWSQTITGSIAGSVVDQSAAVVTGAKVEIVSQDTGAVSSLVSNEAGLFKAPFLNPGKYTVKVSSPGFRSYEQKDLEVALSRESLVNVKLEIGQVGDTVQVEASAPIIEADTSQLSLNVDAKKVVTLPGVQGAVDRLALLSPGVVYGFGNINSNGLVFSANGQRARSNNFLLDGQDNNDPTIGGPGYFFSNIEALGEFQVITNQFSAEYGRNAGAIVNLRVKSGSNQYHGAGTYFRRDDHNWTALTNIQKANGTTTPPKYFDTIFAGQFDGPIIKDKLFFNTWVQREWTRQNLLSIGTGSTLMPTPAGLQTLSQNFPNSVSVQNLVKYGAWGNKQGLSIVPGTTTTKSLTNPAGASVDVEFSSVQRAVSQTGDNWDGGIKVDYRLGSKDTISGKWYQQDNTFANAASNAQAGYLYDNPGRSKQIGGSWVRILTPSTTNEFRFSFIKTGFFFEGGTTFPFTDISKNIANISITGGFLGYGLATNLPQYRLVNSYQYQDNLSKIMGRHSLKMGVQFIKDNIPLGFLPAINGQYIFPNFQAYVDNKPSQFNGAAGTATQEPKELDQAYYIQDDFKVRSNLTLNLGLRYEYSGQPVNLLNDITVARESNPATAIWNTSLPIDARTYPRLRAPSKNFAPRVGFAYSPKGSGSGLMSKMLGQDATVIRGGFSISYDPSFYNLMLNAQTAAPVVYSYSLTGTSVQPMPANISGGNLQSLYAPPKGVDPRTLNQTLFNPNFRSPYSESFSLGVQRRLGRNSGFEVRGVRTRAVAQFATRNGNPNISNFINNGFGGIVSGLTPTTSATCTNCNGRVVPNYGNIRIRDNSGQAGYNGLQTSFNTRTFRNQLLLGASYTWSKTMDNVSEVFSFLGSGSILLAQNPFDVNAGERALSNNNIPHALSMNISWEMPWLKSNKSWYSRLVGGWTVGVFEIWQAGRPMGPVQLSTSVNPLSDTSFNGFAAGYDTLRPFLANPKAPVQMVGQVQADGSIVNLANTKQVVSFNDVHWIYNTLAADKLYGTPFGVGRNVLTGPVFQRADISVFKSFALTERFKLQLRGEATNAFNHVAYGIPNLYVDSGTATTFLNRTTTESAPRVIKLGAKFTF